MTRADVAALLGVSDTTVGRMTAASRSEPVSLDQLLAVGRAAGVPDWFMAHGFAPPADVAQAAARERLDAMDERLEDLAGALRAEQYERARLVEALEAVGGTDLRAALAADRGRSRGQDDR